jgi:outer membrane immunogenic protein
MSDLYYAIDFAELNDAALHSTPHRGLFVKKVLFAAVALAAISAPAYAQDASNFGGAKIGAVIGYDRVRLEVEDEGSGSKDGFLYGVTAGYDLDLGTAVIGVEGEFADASTKETVGDLAVDGFEASLRAERDLYIGARLGFPVSPIIMLYAKGGYTNAKFKLSATDGVDSFSASDELDGYRIGGGVEYTNGQAFGRLEYRYSDYGRYKVDGVDTGIDASRHQIAVVGGWRF